MPKIPKALSHEDRLNLIHACQNRSNRCLNDARDLLESKPYLSVRVSYEAAYHLMTALFICEEIFIPQTHRGVNSVLYSNFVERGFFPKDIAAHLGELEKYRNIDPYEPTQEISTERAQANLQKAEAFCKAMQKLLGEKLER